MEVRTRIAPSPTGVPHIGTAWLALFDYVFAKKNSGKFILRLEDTDRERYILESEKQIFEILKWLGLSYDEGPDIGGKFAPYRQSKRLDIYKKYTDELLEKDYAYRDENAIRFKTKKDGQTSWNDLIGKQISFDNSTQEDFIILKSDGYPTYNFANVIDDHLMEITHVIRGNEFISSTPKHLMIYQAFGWESPEFAHLPVLVGADRAKLSKRHGAKGALEFKTEGYIKEAVINFLALLGWSHPEGKEIFSLDEMIKVFDIKDFNKASAYFDITKFEWMNGEYIRKSQISNLKTQIWEYLMNISDGKLKDGHPTEEEIEHVIPLIKERIKKLSDFVPLTDFLWEEPEYEMEIFNKLKIDNLELKIKKILESLEKTEKPWKADVFEKTFRDLADEMEISVSQMFQLIRVSVSGQTVTPPLFESVQILGEEKTVDRVKKALLFIKS